MSFYDPEPLCAARFTVTADAFPGLLPRILEPFAKRDLIPDLVRATREGDAIRTEVALRAMPLCMVHLVAGNLGQIIGVRRVEAMEGRVVPPQVNPVADTMVDTAADTMVELATAA